MKVLLIRPPAEFVRGWDVAAHAQIPLCLMYLGAALERAGHKVTLFDGAIQDFAKNVELNPKYAGAHLWLGRACFSKGDYDRAAESFTKAIQLQPKKAEAYGRRAQVYHKKKQYDLAWEDVKQCRALGGKVADDFIRQLVKDSGRPAPALPATPASK